MTKFMVLADFSDIIKSEGKMSFNLSKKEIEEKIKKQLAIEFNCVEQDFDKSENVITIAC